MHNAAPLPISRLFANRAHPPASQTTSRQSISLTAADHNLADAVNSRNHPKVAKSLTFVPARVQKRQKHTVFGIVPPSRKQSKPLTQSRYRCSLAQISLSNGRVGLLLKSIRIARTVTFARTGNCVAARPVAQGARSTPRRCDSPVYASRSRNRATAYAATTQPLAGSAPTACGHEQAKRPRSGWWSPRKSKFRPARPQAAAVPRFRRRSDTDA